MLIKVKAAQGLNFFWLYSIYLLVFSFHLYEAPVMYRDGRSILLLLFQKTLITRVHKISYVLAKFAIIIAIYHRTRTRSPMWPDCIGYQELFPNEIVCISNYVPCTNLSKLYMVTKLKNELAVFVVFVVLVFFTAFSRSSRTGDRVDHDPFST